LIPAAFNKETRVQSLFLLIALLSLIMLTLIMVFLVMEGVPVFQHVPVKDFIFGKLWYPTDDDPAFGIFPLITASLSVAGFAGILAIPLGVMTAIYIAEIADRRVAEIVKPVIELIASMPSVIIGFFGMIVVAPFLQTTFDLPVGLNLFNGGLMLAFMATPTICSISEDAIFSVPSALKEGSYALGATKLETIINITIPASLSGISTGAILGLSRAIGETMVVLMVAGGAAITPESIFDPVRPMPATIAAEMAEAPYRSEHYHALFAIAIALFLFTFLFNMAADFIAYKYKQTGEASS